MSNVQNTAMPTCQYACGPATAMTFQHAPYGYNAVPEQFRTVQSLSTPPKSPQQFAVSTTSTGRSSSPAPALEQLYGPTRESSTASFEMNSSSGGGNNHHTTTTTPLGAVAVASSECSYSSSAVPPYPQVMQPYPGRASPAPSAASTGSSWLSHPHRSFPRSNNTVALPLAVTHIVPQTATVYDQSALPSNLAPKPPSYKLALGDNGANPGSPSHSNGTAPLFLPHPHRPMLTRISAAAGAAVSVSEDVEPTMTTPKSTSANSVNHLPSKKVQDGVKAPSQQAAHAKPFKAHHYLEKAGVPFHQFPIGGKLPTPDHWPQHCSIDGSTMYPNTYRAFIGQVRFETTTEQIAWVVQQVTGVTAAFVAYHRNGCFVAHFLTEEECAAAVGHHKKILFDLHGVWDLMETGDVEADAHRSEVLTQVLGNKGNLHKHRLPRGCMVIERFANNRHPQGSLPSFAPRNQQFHGGFRHTTHASPCHTAGGGAHYVTYLHGGSGDVNTIVPNVHSRDNSM